ncbi:MAG: acetamidase/formamidase family protein [Deltaproteobacteria bacterium]|nr:acetamidase/formamidase family protein [Deltaproteobacteria bacterium]
MKLRIFKDIEDRRASRTNRFPRSHRLEPTGFVHAFRSDLPSACTLEPGDTIEATTQDASNGKVRSTDDLPGKVAQRPWVNPMTGPIIINDAEPGDALIVETLSIEPLEERGFSWIREDFGALVATTSTALLNAPLPEAVWPYKIRGGKVIFRSRMNDREIILPYRPFLGTIGCATPEEAPHSLIPGRHGGNMDAVDNGVGSFLILPILVPGAYLYFGDAHAVQGDGELCGVAVEISARVRLQIDLIKGRTVRWPMIESADAVMAVGSARPLEDAYRIACKEIVLWLQEEYGFDLLDAYQLASQTLTCRIGNVVDPFYSVVARFPKVFLY